MIYNNTTARAARANYRALVLNSMFRSPLMSWFRQLFMIIDSTTEEDTFAFLRGIPRMREWIGDRKLKSISEVSFKIGVKKWESTVEILREDFMFDRFGQIRIALNQLGQAYPLHLADYVIDLLANGFSTDSYDGQFFFDTDHPNYGGGVWSNRSAAVISSTAWEAAQLGKAGIREPDGGRWMSIRWTHLFYGPGAYPAQNALFGKDTLATGETNVYLNAIPADRRIQIDELGTSAKWFLFDLSKPIKPFILKVVRNVEFTALDRPTDFNVFNREAYLYGISSMDNAAYGFPELAFGSTAGE
jgi:phage major head subunit gpT-like protein